MADPNDNSARSMLGALWAEAGLATILVAMRYYTRIRINRVMGWDDHIMLIAMVSINVTIKFTFAADLGSRPSLSLAIRCLPRPTHTDSDFTKFSYRRTTWHKPSCLRT